MRRATRILLVSGMLVLGVSTAEAGLWGRKAEGAPNEAVPPSATTLTAIEVDGSRVLLRTSAAPAYTSYSPSRNVYVVDLSGTSRSGDLVIPASLPPAVTSVSADEAVEMGSRLTRVTFRFSEPLRAEVSAIEKAVVVTIPAPAVAPVVAEEAADALPRIVPMNDPEVAVAETPAVAVEEVIEEPIVAVPVVETRPAAPVAVQATLPPARAVKRVDARKTDGNVEVRIAGDGKLEYKAFRLESPSRLVIDLAGVRDAVAKKSVAVDDAVVQRVRVAQFQPTVARVVVDLKQKTNYDIVSVGDELRIAFGASPEASTARPVAAPAPAAVAERPAAPAPVRPAAPAPVVTTVAEKPAPAIESKPVKQPLAADIPSQVPTIADNAPGWNVPEPASKGARRVINSPDQAPPPQRPIVQEDVFADPMTQRPADQVGGATVQTLSGTRNLSGGARIFTGEPISLSLKDADIRDVLRTFAGLTGLNIAVDPGVSGTVTVDFVDVPWDQALDLILRQNALTFTIEGNVMRVGTIERLAAETAATRRLAEEERLNVPLTTYGFKLSYARAPEVAGLLRDIASPRARIIVDPRTNQLIVSEIPAFLGTMQNLIATVDIPTRQVMIEARIVETQSAFSQQWGFDWGFGGDLDPALGTGTGLVFPNRVGFDGGPFAFGLGEPVFSISLRDVLGTFNLDLALRAAEAQGFVKVVSAPRVTTQDNQAAEIQSGVQIPYQTRINFTTTVSYLDATLRLSVTPQITAAGTVIMDIQVQKNEPATGLTIAGAAGTPLTTRQARTRLMVRDGGTAVIAGIFQTRDNDAETRVPFLHNIPVLGALFRSHDISTSHDELLIFITPRIVRG